MKNAILKLAAAFAVALAASLVACSNEDDDKPVDKPVVVTGVTVSPTELTMPVGTSARTLTAAVLPANASQAVSWSSGTPAVATVSGSGAVTPLTIGTTTITVKSTADETKTATCLVHVVELVQATKLLLPAAITIAAGTQGNNLTADVWPSAASLMGVEWQSSNTAIVVVSGTGVTATLAGVGVGTSTITATSVGSPGATATCTVNVAGYVYREVYTPTDGDMIVNGEFAVYNGNPRAVAIDGSGTVHAAVYDYDVYAAAYYKDGAKVAVLPASPGYDEFVALSIHVTYDNRVYIAGYEYYYDYDIWQQTTRAKVYAIDGSTAAAVPLEGLGDWFYTDALAVHAAGGNTYVCGAVSSDGDLIDGAALWVNGKMYVYRDLEWGNPQCLATMGADLYMGGQAWGIVKIDPADPGDFQSLGYDLNGVMVVKSLCALDGDIYAAGWIGGDTVEERRAVLWRNHVPQQLPWDPTRWDWLEYPHAEAAAVTIGRDGAVYVFGSEAGIWRGYRLHRPILWKNGIRQVAIPIDSPDAGYSTSYEPLRTVAVRELSGVVVASVTLAPTALELAVYDSETLTAAIAPGNASDRRLTWTNSNPSAVSLTIDGNTATVEALAAGRATITVVSPDGPQASCVVDAVTVPVIGVMASPGALDVGRGRFATIDAAIAPFNATDKSVTWASQNPNIVEVVGAVDRQVSVKGVSAGTTGVTVTTNDGGFTATCTVTVTDSAEPAIYMVGNFGMFIDGVPYLGIDRDHNRLRDVVVDDTGNIHAVGDYVEDPDSYYWQASYYRNGVRTLLPPAFASTTESHATGMALDANGDVYIVGYEYNPWWQHARLWKVAAAGGAITRIPLQGIYDGLDTYLPSEARAVRLHGGNVYVAGYLNYLTNPDDEWSGTTVATLWKDGVNYTCTDPDDPTAWQPFSDLAITSGGYVYLLAEHWQRPLYRTPISNPSAFEQVYVADAESLTMYRIHADGDSYYIAGTRTSQAFIWVNGQRQVLYDAPGATQTEATDVFVYEGKAYLGGSLVIGDWDYFHTGLWIGSGTSYEYIDDMRAIPNDWPYPDYAAVKGIYVKR